jgi:hypothetical protein
LYWLITKKLGVTVCDNMKTIVKLKEGVPTLWTMSQRKFSSNFRGEVRLTHTDMKCRHDAQPETWRGSWLLVA